ncbi:hypothetical protein HAP39_06305 [Elizabethkingia miricola]|nr:hypothetical protein [Elizabethkingia meningoseptica]NHQ66949.1 hypothetical protein [Elizabethkingia miricola]NHQ70184.1 hypothetical protein [Elizabethkingia miricola]NHQ77034.1 hypothetical protein [Elizabethkingia miricola]
MIKTTQISDVIRMEIKMHIPQSDIFTFLQMEGYEVKSFVQKLPATEEMLVNEPRTELHTFTATKPWEKQCENTLYLKVFEKEVKKLLKAINK